MGCIYGFRMVPSINHYFLQQHYVANHFNGTRVFYMNWELEFFLPFFVLKGKKSLLDYRHVLVCVFDLVPRLHIYVLCPRLQTFQLPTISKNFKKIAADPQTSDIGVTPATFPVSPKTMSGNVPWKKCCFCQ